MSNSSVELANRCIEFMYHNDSMSKKMGMRVENVSEESVRVSMRVTQEMLNGHGTCHGGQLFSLADSTFAFACNADNQMAVAASCTIDFIRPAFEADVLTATAVCLHQGQRTGIYQVQIFNQHQKLIAIFKGNSSRLSKTVLPESSK